MDAVWAIDLLVVVGLLGVMIAAPSNRVAVTFLVFAIPGVMHEWGWL